MTTLSMLAQHKMSRTLAKPTLVAMRPASNFLAGGEVPFQKSNGLNDTLIEFKQFGVELSKPTVLSDSTIQLNTMVVSENLTLWGGPGRVSTFGFEVIDDTTVRLKDGQSLHRWLAHR